MMTDETTELRETDYERDAREYAFDDAFAEAQRSLGWIKDHLDAAALYVAARKPSGETLYGKLCEWNANRGGPNTPPRWPSLLPGEKAFLDVTAAHFLAKATAKAKWFPDPPAPPAVTIVAGPPSIEDTIAEPVGSLAEVDPHRLEAAKAVARILEKAGLQISDVEAAMSIDDTGDDEDDEDGDGETMDGDEIDAGAAPGDETPPPDEAPGDETPPPDEAPAEAQTKTRRKG